jgi:hypothetical protein
MNHDIELDAEAFLTGQPEIVAMMRARIRTTCEWMGPDVVAYIIQRVDVVPNMDSDDDYIAVACAVLRVAAEEAMRPKLEALKAETAMHRARAEALEAACESSMREWDAFLRMRTSRTIQ